ncbi:MAG: hypothetical protein J7L96_01745, partial [Bacteroidales bacterium]|nr:hypothetical protein [Bacteroidales bacterium]
MTRNQHRTIIFTVLFSLFTLHSFAQTEQAQIFKNFRETVWLSSDRHLYLSGETLNFNAMLLEKDSYQPSQLSNAVRIELIDTDGNKLIKTNLELTDSQVKSSLSLPPDIKSGWYYIRAYTNWMRNFSANEFSLLRIKILNPAGENSITIDHSLSVNNSLNEESGTAAKIDISDSNNSKSLKVSITMLNQDAVSGIKLLVHQSYSWYWFDKKAPGTREISFELPKSILPQGIVQFSVLSDNNTILVSQLWSKYKPQDNNNSISIKNSNLHLRSKYKATYTPMTPQSGRISTRKSSIACLVALQEPTPPYEAGVPGLPGWSANAMIPNDKQEFQICLNSHHYSDDIVIAFFSTKSGDPISPAPPDKAQEPDLSGISYLPETRAGILSGRVIDSNINTPVPSTLIALTVLNNKRFDASRTNKDGLFYFAFPDINSSLDYIINFTSEPDPAWEIEMIPGYDKRITRINEPAFTLSTEELEYLKQVNINEQLNKAYADQSEKTENLPDTAAINNIFFYPPDYTIEVGDYIKLANVREVIYEVVPNVNIRTHGDRQIINFYFKNPVSQAYETLVLLDGIAITSYNELLDLPPDRIKSIEVKNKIFIHGDNIFSAIINFISPNGDYAGLDLPKKAILSSIDLPLKNNNYHLPDVNSADPNIPVLNNTLLWTSTLNNSPETIDFMTNDLS